MSQHHADEPGPAAHDHEHRASSAPVTATGATGATGAQEEEMADTEQYADSSTGLLEEQATSAPTSGWRDLAWSAISGDAMWNEARLMRNRY